MQNYDNQYNQLFNQVHHRENTKTRQQQQEYQTSSQFYHERNDDDNDDEDGSDVEDCGSRTRQVHYYENRANIQNSRPSSRPKIHYRSLDELKEEFVKIKNAIQEAEKGKLIVKPSIHNNNRAPSKSVKVHTVSPLATTATGSSSNLSLFDSFLAMLKAQEPFASSGFFLLMNVSSFYLLHEMIESQKTNQPKTKRFHYALGVLAVSGFMYYKVLEKPKKQ